MMSSKSLPLLIFFLLSLVSVTSYSQLYDFKGSADHRRSTDYGEDTIIVFFSDNERKVMAASHTTEDTSNFLWKRFNRDTQEFDSLLIHKDTTLSRIHLDSLYSRNDLKHATEGMRVEILSDEDSLELFNAWVILDTMPDFGEMEIAQNNCESIWLSVDQFELENYEYYNLADSPYVSTRIYNNRNVTWESSEDVDIFDPETLYNYGDRFIGKIGTPLGMPYKDSDYTLTVRNVFGNSRSKTIEGVEAKAVKAEFDVKKILNDGSVVDYNKNEVNEALLDVTFENKSKNAQYYDWVGFNDSLNILRGRDSILWSSEEEIPLTTEVEPYKPGKYPVRLTVSNDYGCYDSTTFYHIEADSSRIDTTQIPNVFTPNDDGKNDYFVLPKKSNITGGKRGVVSMKWIEVSVFNRSGELVYRFNGDPENWKGWNGKVRNSNRDAAEGVYIYVIKGRGYDGVMHEDRQYSGFLYLFREN
ncbi:MAG: gliding motility-associated C-terminal domain-containing protein [Bacteroidales bacterium]|nr:gliding motility-associated C-terminal domain-containing protein [Bacteroidales bacterium]